MFLIIIFLNFLDEIGLEVYVLVIVNLFRGGKGELFIGIGMEYVDEYDGWLVEEEDDVEDDG